MFISNLSSYQFPQETGEREGKKEGVGVEG